MIQILQLDCAEEEINDMKVTLATTINELLKGKLISVRTYNVCNSNKLHTVGEIKNYYNANLGSFINLRKCGRKSSDELCAIVGDMQPIVVEGVSIDKFETVNQIIRQTFIDEYELFVSDPVVDKNLVAVFQKKFSNPSSLFSESIYNTSNLLSEVTFDERMQYFFMEKVVSILCDIAKQLEHKLPEGDEFAVNFSNVFKSIEKTFKTNYLVDYCKYKLNKSRREFLKKEYSQSVEVSSIIVKKFADSYINSFYELIPLLKFSKDDFILMFGHKKKIALEYYNKIRNPFCKIFESILYEDIDEDALGISANFPFLTKDSVEWVKSFYRRTSYYPMFYVVYEFLKRSSRRDAKMFCLKFGLNDNHSALSLEGIAQKFNLTRERVRQMLIKLNKEDIFNSPFWKRYFAQEVVLITNTSDFFLELCSTEKVPLSFVAFAGICNIIFKFQFSDEFGCEFCCTKKYFSEIHEIFSKFNDLKKKKYSEDASFKICDVVPRQILDIPGIKETIVGVIIPAMGIDTSDDSLLFRKNVVDVEKEAFDILYKKGEPIHIKELVSEIKGNNAQFELTEGAIKNKIRLSKKVLPIGKSSMYKLPHWRNVFGGSIRDLLRKIISERETPVCLDELTLLVTDVFKRTNRKSINANLLSSDEFVCFNDGYFGLRTKTYPSQFVETALFKQRSSFDVRFKSLQEFVNTYFRIPYYSGADDEDSLCRWYKNVLHGNMDTTEGQRYKLKEFLEANKDLPQNGAEVRFKNLCQGYIDYVKDNYELPNLKDCSTLYNWFKKTMTDYKSYNDNRKKYFSKLIDELESYGFSFIDRC